MDTISTQRRSYVMSRIQGKDTKPEMLVRKTTFALGYRYRLHTKDIPGKPDLVFKSRKKAIFVHGCFWHRHAGCVKAYRPKSNVEFWEKKFAGNVARDRRVLETLRQDGWETLVLWECEMKDLPELAARIKRFLGPTGLRARSRRRLSIPMVPLVRKSRAPTDDAQRRDDGPGQ